MQSGLPSQSQSQGMLTPFILAAWTWLRSNLVCAAFSHASAYECSTLSVLTLIVKEQADMVLDGHDDINIAL